MKELRKDYSFILETPVRPATVHKWVWFWRVGWHKVRGWSVEDRTFLKVKMWRETRFDDFVYGDGYTPIGIAALDLQTKASYGGIERSPNDFWRNKK